MCRLGYCEHYNRDRHEVNYHYNYCIYDIDYAVAVFDGNIVWESTQAQIKGGG